MITNIEIWSLVIKQKRLSWLVHQMRLGNETPAKKAFAGYIKPEKKKIGRLKTEDIMGIPDIQRTKK